jgi:predicted amidophosphoribosyltransferase
MIDSVTFAACYVYSPDGEGGACRRSRLLRTLLKAGDAQFMVRYAMRVRQQALDASPLAGFFESGPLLVPVPGSKPSRRAGDPVSLQLAEALIEEGLGRGIWRGLLRVRPVRKSATAAPGDRPTVGIHYDSFAVEPAAPAPPHVVLVDDVITKGRTLLAAAARLKDAHPRIEVRAFALVRTMGLIGAVDRLVDPCVGEIRWRAGDAHRDP